MIRLRDHIRSLALRRRRGVVSVEAVLAFPALLVLFGAVAQTMLLAKSRMYVEQAAYAAARSAKVHKCPDTNLLDFWRSPIAAIRGGDCTDRPEKWLDAARWALVPASPTSAAAPGRGACPEITAGQDIIAASVLSQGLQPATNNAICYAFEPGNVVVSNVAWVDGLVPAIEGSTATPIEVTVRFKYPLNTPFRRFLYDGKRPDGTYWRWGEATVTLL